MLPILPVSIGIMFKDVGPSSLKIWMQERREEGPLNGLWEFPGGKIEAGESPQQALVREIEEEVGINIDGLFQYRLFKLYSYQHNGKTIGLYTYIVNVGDDELPNCGQWFDIDQMKKSMPFQGLIPPINHSIIDELTSYSLELFQEGNFEELWKP